MKSARESFEGEHPLVPVRVRATLRVGERARLSAFDGEHRVEVEGEPVQSALNRGLDEARVIEQLRKTGGTPFTLTDVELDADPAAFCPAALVNGLRRDALKALTEARIGRSGACGPMALPSIQPTKAGTPRLYVQSGSVEALNRALSCGADVAVYAPEDLRSEALSDGLIEGIRLGPGQSLALAVPAVLSGKALSALNAWALERKDRISETLLSNVGQLGLNWPGRRIADYMLNAASDLAVQQLRDWGLDGFSPSVELTAQQIDRMGGDKNLVVWGRIPLMHLRHCPLRAARGMKGLHAECRHCDACAPEDRLNGRLLVDRRSAAFPLNRLAMPGGCVVQVLNSVPLMPLRRRERLPEASGWRLLLRPEEPVEDIVRVYRAALRGEDFRALGAWERLEALETTTGHYFRGVE